MSVTLKEKPAVPANRNSVMLPYARQWRAHALLTQEQLATRAGVSAWSVMRAESGQPVSILTAERMARALGIPVRDFQRDPDAPQE